MALQSMAEIGAAVGDLASAARYNETYAQLVPLYHRRFWNASLGTWASDPLELQTLTALSLAAGVGSASERVSAVEALDRDVQSRGDHLTVGAAGVKWLLRTLSEGGRHDTALRLAMQTSYPSWGWWIARNATTCWESWSGVADPSHTSHPTHNREPDTAVLSRIPTSPTGPGSASDRRTRFAQTSSCAVASAAGSTSTSRELPRRPLATRPSPSSRTYRRPSGHPRSPRPSALSAAPSLATGRATPPQRQLGSGSGCLVCGSASPMRFALPLSGCRCWALKRAAPIFACARAARCGNAALRFWMMGKACWAAKQWLALTGRMRSSWRLARARSSSCLRSLNKI